MEIVVAIILGLICLFSLGVVIGFLSPSSGDDQDDAIENRKNNNSIEFKNLNGFHTGEYDPIHDGDGLLDKNKNNHHLL